MDGKAPVTVENIRVLLNEYGGMLRFRPHGTPEFRLIYDPDILIEANEELLLEKTVKLLEDMNILYEPALYT